VAKIEYQEFCGYCDAPLDELEDVRRRPAKFCCPQHRALYHNKMKSLARITENIFRSIAQLGDMMHTDNGLEFRYAAAKSLMEIGLEVERRTPNSRYLCVSCGQEKFTEPMKDDVCAFCGSTNSFRRKLSFNHSK